MGRLFPLLLCIIFSSCIVNRQRQVWFGALQQTHHADTARVIRVYFDKAGNLYPNRDNYIPYKYFFDPINGIRVNNERTNNGNLRYFYSQRPDFLRNAFTNYHLLISSISEPIDSFSILQGIIRKQFQSEIERYLADSEEKVLVVFIHGFNDPDPTGDYQRLRNAIRAQGFDKENFVYLEVYWDGLTANQGNPVFEGIWKRSLKNSAYVSLGLRKLLSGLDNGIDIRIITHSLGASVGTGALFNTENKWRQKGFKNVGRKLESEYDMNYYDLLHDLPTPEQKIRIGMIAPAIPGYQTFRDFNNRTPGISIEQNNITRIIVGININDYAVTKRFLKTDMARYFGSTSLGCDKKRKGKTELQRTQEALRAIGYSSQQVNTLLRPVDFSLYGERVKNEEHGLYYYLQHKDCLQIFLRELFDE